jgi:DNA-binding MarR family transcriptional regulator
MVDITANLLGAVVVAFGDELADTLSADSGHGCSDAAALLSVHYRDPLTVSALSRIVGLTHAGTVRLVDRLEDRGSLRRRPGPDGRSVSLELTPAGRRAAVALQRGRLDLLERVLSPLDSTERDQLHRLLDKLLDNVTRDRRHARHLCRLCDHERCRNGDCPVDTAATTVERAASDSKNRSQGGRG